jgi:acetate kinase
VDAIAHRGVHGGPRFHAAVRIDDDVVRAIEQASELAPLHNGPALEAIRAARGVFATGVPMVAAFDTSFFADLPDVAREYALPQDVRDKLQIRRYGFHGLAHRYMIERYRALRPDVARPRLVTLQLGSGCSATASLDGRPLDTSMGFTPLEGLIMGTRSGDIDPMLPLLLAEQGGMSVNEVEALLNKKSGLLGLSGRSNDMRDLQTAAAEGDAAAGLALRAFCYRIVKYIGAYMAVLAGADAIVFGGGIGERSAEVRAAVCDAFAWCGLELDAALNSSVGDDDTFISAAGARLEALVVRVDEASVIARDVLQVLNRRVS